MKKIISILMIAICILSFTGCQASPDPSYGERDLRRIEKTVMQSFKDVTPEDTAYYELSQDSYMGSSIVEHLEINPRLSANEVRMDGHVVRQEKLHDASDPKHYFDGVEYDPAGELPPALKDFNVRYTNDYSAQVKNVGDIRKVALDAEVNMHWNFSGNRMDCVYDFDGADYDFNIDFTVYNLAGSEVIVDRAVINGIALSDKQISEHNDLFIKLYEKMASEYSTIKPIP